MKPKIQKLQLNKNTTKNLGARTNIKAGLPRTTGISCDPDACLQTWDCPNPPTRFIC